MARNYKEVHEIWKEQALEISSSPDHWISFLSTASWHYKYSFEDQILRLVLDMKIGITK